MTTLLLIGYAAPWSAAGAAAGCGRPGRGLLRHSRMMVFSTRMPSRTALQVALAVDAAALVAGNLVDLEPGLGGADVHQGLDLEAVAVEVEHVQVAGPEGVVAVAEVGVAGCRTSG